MKLTFKEKLLIFGLLIFDFLWACFWIYWMATHTFVCL